MSYFIDNQKDNNLYKIINSYLKENKIESFDIASAFFTPSGLNLLSKEIKKLKRVRILIGADPIVPEMGKSKEPSDPEEPEYSNQILKQKIKKQIEAMKTDRNKMDFTEENYNLLKNIINDLNNNKIQVRQYKQNFLHAKAYIFNTNDDSYIIGSSNLTVGGLKSNLELNIGSNDKFIHSKLLNWYEDLWSKSKEINLVEIYSKALEKINPFIVFLKVLYEMYGVEIDEEEEKDKEIELAQFQYHGVKRAQKLLNKYHGVLIADGVGLGKTHMACELTKFYSDRRQKILILCPAPLENSWNKHIITYKISAVVISYQKFANHIKYLDTNGKEGSKHIVIDVDDFALVIIDEAHNYRNPDAPTLAKTLDKFLLGKRRDLVELTATPVNNSLWDLHYLLRYFLKHDSSLVDIGIRSLKDKFQEAMDFDPFDLSPDILYPIIDATTVKRPRRFIKKYYSDNTIPDEEGNQRLIKFPKPIPLTLNYSFNETLSNFMEDFELALMPEEGNPLLKLARYKPELYLKNPSETDSQEVNRRSNSVDGLLRTSLLKRIESSIHSFQISVKRMIIQHEIFLDSLKNKIILTSEFFREYDNDDDNLLSALESFEENDNISKFDIEKLKDDVENDLRILKSFEKNTSQLNYENDDKLKKLKIELINIIKEAKNDAPIVKDAQQYRKVLIFSFFNDTVNWINDYLIKEIEKDDMLADYKNRIAVVSGSKTHNNKNKDEIVYDFAPISTKSPTGNDRYDILICTDVLAEGLNLHQCRNIINYDLPWNPMRLVQRHGRIDRINSKYEKVFLRSFFPENYTEKLLKLIERIKSKLAMAAKSVGEESTPIIGGSTSTPVFSDKEDIENIKNETTDIFEEGGTRSAAQSGEEYRQILRKELNNKQYNFVELPWHSGTIIKTNYKEDGYVFLGKIISSKSNYKKNYLRFVPLKKDKNINRQDGFCLRLIECDENTKLVKSKHIDDNVFEAWKRAKEDIYEEWNFFTDPKNLQPKVRKINRDVQKHLVDFPPEISTSRAFKSIMNPLNGNQEKELRIILKDEKIDNFVKSSLLVEKIETLGVEPFKQPETYPEISDKLINLVCWFGIVKS